MTEKNTQPTTEDVVATPEPTSDASVEAKAPQAAAARPQGGREIGRASCRERVSSPV